MKLPVCLALLPVLGLLGAPAAMAYPSSVVFAPVGDCLELGVANFSLYNAFYGPAVGPNVWAGVNVGVLPSIPYGKTGLAFGGAELGVDVIQQVGLGPDIKPIFNGKLQLLVETDYLPALSLGVMDLHPQSWSRSLNYAYGVATKGLSLRGVDLGRVSWGLGYALPQDPALYSGGSYNTTGNLSALAGYETPMFGPFYLGLDHVGGNSEVSSTNLALNFQVAEGVFGSLGYTFSNDRTDTSYDGVFVQMFGNTNLLGWLAPRADAEETP